MTARLLFRVLATALAVACTSDPLQPGAPVASVQVSVPATSMTAGTSMQASALPRDAAGSPLPDRPVTWTSSRPETAPVSGTGRVTALAPGEVRITATSEARSAWVDLQILAAAAPVVAVRIDGDDALDAQEGEAIQLVARVLGPADSLLEDRPITWHSQMPAVASVSSAGLVVAVAEGSSRIIATAGGPADTVRIVVRRAQVAQIGLGHDGVVSLLTGDRWQLLARALDASGADLPGRTIEWTVEDPRIATVTASGAVTALAVGSTDAIATVEGLTARVALDVRSRIQRVVVSPGTVVMGTGEASDLSAQLLDANGFALDRTVTWTSEDDDVVSVDDQGQLVAVGPGSTRVRAEAEGQQGVASVVVMEWVDRPLEAVGDSALPATIRLRSIEAPGSPTRTERVLAIEGVLRVIVTGSMTGRYQMEIVAWTLREGAPVQAGILGVRGDMTYSALTGTLHLAVPGGPGFTATPLPGGAWQVIGALWPGDGAVDLRFGRPAGW